MHRNIAAKTKERRVTRLRTEFDELRVDIDGRDNATKMKARSESRTPPKMLKVVGDVSRRAFRMPQNQGGIRRKKKTRRDF